MAPLCHKLIKKDVRSVKRTNITPKELPKKDGIEPLTPEARENQMISLAMDLAEQRLRDGTASAQEVVHFLKLGASTTKYEKQLDEAQVRLAETKIKAYEQSQKVEELYANAISAMRLYSGQNNGDESSNL